MFKRQWSLIVILALLLGALPQAVGAQSANFTASVIVSDVTSGAAVVGGMFTTDVSLSVTNTATPATGVMGIDLWLRFSPTYVRVADADGNPANGTQVAISTQFFGSSIVVAANEVTACPTGGQCVHIALSHTGSPITNKTGKLATITWGGMAAGPTGFRIMPETVLADADGLDVPITSTTVSAITIVEAGIIRGRVERQGTRTDHANTFVVAYNAGGGVVTDTLTAADGTFTLTVPAGGSYLVQAVYNGYLKTQKSSVYVVGGTVNLGTTSLLGGDVTADNNVNILDIVTIINRYNTSGWATTEPADLNDDTFINLYDLTIAAGNFGRFGPIAW